MTSKIFITGGTGFIGRRLTEYFSEKDADVTVLTRKENIQNPIHKAVYIQGDAVRPGPWQEVLPHQSFIINLAGAPIFTSWNQRKKEDILQSRVYATRNIVNSLIQSKNLSSHLISASAVGFYGFHGSEVLDEKDSPGDDFLAQVTQEWEKEASAASDHGIPVTVMRLGVVLGRGGGALHEFEKISRQFSGAHLGHGKQWVSWIHLQDVCRALSFLIENSQMTGPVNLTSPYPVRNMDITRVLAEITGESPGSGSIPAFLLKLRLGEFSELLLKGQRVIPSRLSEAGFEFQFPYIKEALEDLLT